MKIDWDTYSKIHIPSPLCRGLVNQLSPAEIETINEEITKALESLVVVKEIFKKVEGS